RGSRGPVCQACRPVAGPARPGGDTGLATPPAGTQGVLEPGQPDGVRLALLLRQDAGAERARADGALRQDAAPAGVRLASRGSGQPVGGGPARAGTPAGAGGGGLPPAFEGSAALAGPGHRPGPHAGAGAPGQGDQGSAGSPVAAVAGRTARLLARVPAGAGAVCQPGAAAGPPGDGAAPIAAGGAEGGL